MRKAIPGLLRVTAIVVSGWYALAILRHVRGTSHFFGDDLFGFWLARTHPLREYLLIPIDVHAVPLHRLVNYVFAYLAPMNFDAALATLSVFHLLGLLTLYKSLELLRRTPSNPFFFAWYGTNVYFGPLFVWWTSGLHRLPSIWLMGLAIYAYLRYREGAKRRWAAAVLASIVGALGFFEKGALIPLVLGGIEVCLWSRTERSARRSNVALLACSVVVVAIYIFGWRLVVGSDSAALETDVDFLLKYFELSWWMLGNSLTGSILESAWPALCLGAVLLVSIIWTRRWTWIPALVVIVVASVSLLSTGISKDRAQHFGYPLAVFSYRYYPEVAFLVVFFLAIAWHRLEERFEREIEPTKRTRLLRAAMPLVASAALIAVGANAYGSYVRLSNAFYVDLARHKRYLDTLRSNLSEIVRPGRSLVFTDGTMPYKFGGRAIKHSMLLADYGIEARFSKAKPGVYRIDENGNIRKIRARKRRRRPI